MIGGSLTALRRVGTTKGELTILDYQFLPNKESYYICACSCSAIKNIPTDLIYNTKSCGHLRTQSKVINPYENIFNRWKSFELPKRKYKSTLTMEQFTELSKGDCFYCGTSPKNKSRIKDVCISGIDRVDNAIGYDYSNCVSCCRQCNIAKNQSTVDEFLLMCKKVYERNNLG